MKQINKPIIAVIDDDPAILHSLVTLLENDYNVKPFKSGTEAVRFINYNSVDLIFLDHSMPDITGFDVLNILQKSTTTKEIPVIFLTGSHESEKEISALENGAVDYITKPIRAKILLARTHHQIELLQHKRHLETLVDERTKNLNEAYQKLKKREDITLNMLARATDLRDQYTGGHIERTTEYVKIIIEEILVNPCKDYSISQAEADDIIRSAKLHDLGKIAIADNVLLKNGKLTDEEFEAMKKHTANGQQFLDHFIHEMEDPFLQTARDIAHFHHERWDGEGYPGIHKGKGIPLSARIVAIADVYDALVSVRPYKTSFSHEKAMLIIIENSGRQFDPHLVQIFEKHENKIVNITNLGNQS